MNSTPPPANVASRTADSALHPAQFAAEFQQCHSRLWLLAAAILGDRHLAEDVVQDAGIVALQQLGKLEPGTSFVAWMVNPSGTGSIDFETNAATVEFWTRLRTGANGSSVYTAYDDANQVVDSLEISIPGAFQLVSFGGNIDRIEIINNATGGMQMNSIDNLGFSPISEPSSLTLGFAGLVTFATARRRGKRLC